MNRVTKKAFTLIEILVVVAIIGVLTGITILMLDNAQAKPRDSKRVADLATIVTAFRMYYDANKTYIIPGTGCIIGTTAGNGWFNYSGGSCYTGISINQGLINAGYLGGTVIDPSGNTVNRSYMFYYYGDAKASAYAWLENPTAEQSATIAASASPSGVSSFHMNYAATITP